MWLFLNLRIIIQYSAIHRKVGDSRMIMNVRLKLGNLEKNVETLKGVIIGPVNKNWFVMYLMFPKAKN